MGDGLSVPFIVSCSKLHAKQLQEKLGKGKEVGRLVNKHLKILYWPSTREWEREQAGDPDPERTRWANLARSGSQSECRIRFIFPARGIQPYNEIQYNRLNFKRAVPLAAIKAMAPVAALYLCHIMFINLVQLTNPFFIPAFFSASVHFLPIQTNIPVLPQSRIKQSYNDINRLINESGHL